MVFFILMLFSLNNDTLGMETCSRTALIKYQEILVDTNFTLKGEGLRYYLEKDSAAKYYLDRYQEGTKIQWENAILGTIGTGLLLAGVFKGTEDVNPDIARSKKKTRTGFLLGGGLVIVIHFFVSSILDEHNEENLHRAIQEYNKRNLPHIHFNPLAQDEKGRYSSEKAVIYLDKTWEF
ncbi:MAG: hypothetical protein OXB84_08685 [Halobacteriovoraceae bacterium]|nr:hypothetical protein [Halobacteriovoraceae bacterium]